MAPAKQITPRDWMLIHECARIMEALNVEKTVPQALFVGGCVRNILLNKPVKDLDIATLHLPQKVIELCEAAGFKTFPTGIDHGTVTVVIGKQSFEVTTLRRDVATDGRRATVAFSTDWREDAARRDFTMNTLLADLNGNIFDPTGQGIRDLEARHVIFVGDAEQRIKEDTLRILRFFRFHAYYGRGAAHQQALSACANLSDNIPNLSRERISQEFYKILMAEQVIETLELMQKNNVLSDILPENFESLSRLVANQKQYDLEHLEGRLYVLLGGVDTLTELSKTYFIYSNAQKKFFEQMAALHKEGGNIKKLIYLHGKEVTSQFLLSNLKSDELDRAIGVLNTWDIPKFPLSGADAQAVGFKQGKAMGDSLRNVEEWWISNAFEPCKTMCLNRLKELLG